MLIEFVPFRNMKLNSLLLRSIKEHSLQEQTSGIKDLGDHRNRGK